MDTEPETTAGFRPSPVDEDDDLTTKLARRFIDTFPWLEVEAVETHLALGRALHKSISALERYVRYDGGGLNRSRWNFLAVLFLAPGHQRTVGAIAREVGISPASITRLLDNFESEGLVERVPSRNDRRITYARLTEKGLTHSEQVLPDFLRFVQDVGASLSREEKVQLSHLLHKYEVGASKLTSRPTLD